MIIAVEHDKPCLARKKIYIIFFRVMNCLIDKLDDESMTDECEDRLLEIQYFVVRDFR